MPAQTSAATAKTGSLTLSNALIAYFFFVDLRTPSHTWPNAPSPSTLTRLKESMPTWLVLAATASFNDRTNAATHADWSELRLSFSS